MLEMLTFWITYGIWMVLTWGGVIFCVSVLFNTILQWVTDNDYNIDNFMDEIFYHNNLLNNPLTVAILAVGLGFQIFHSGAMVLDTISPIKGILSYHEFASQIANWVGEYATTPVTIVVSLISIAVLAKKAYPLFKKIKNAVKVIDKQS